MRPQLTFEVKITDTYTEKYYEEKVRFFANGSRMVMGVDYVLLYAPVIDEDILLLMIAMATSLKMILYFWTYQMHSKVI